MTKARINVYAAPETKRRIEPAIDVTAEALFDELGALRSASGATRGQTPLDLDAVLDQVRHERDDALLPLS